MDTSDPPTSPPASTTASASTTSPSKVDKVAVATKHPGVFMETSELEAETGAKLPRARAARGGNSGDLKNKKKLETSPKKVAEAEKPSKEEGEKEEEVKKEAADDVEAETEPSSSSAAVEAEVEVALHRPASPPKEESSEKEEKSAGVSTRRSQRRLQAKEDEPAAAASPPPPPALEAPSGDEAMDTSPETAVEAKAETEAAGSAEPKMEVADEAEHSEADSLDSADLKDGGDNESVESGSSSLRSSRTGSKASAGGSDQRSKKAAQAGKKGKGKSGKGGAAAAGGKGVAVSAKGKSRRYIFKKSAAKAPTSVAKAVTSDRVYYKGQYYTRGDIVSVTDVDGGIYYGQLRGFLTDQYCEKSGVLTWLLPTTRSPRPEDGFDAATYVVGPEEELPRQLDFFTFVMHAPDDYFYHRHAPYPTLEHRPDQEYLLTRQGPKVRLIKDNGKAVYKNVPV